MWRPALLLLLLAVACPAQTASVTGSIGGAVTTPAGEPVRGAGIRLSVVGSETTYFVFSDAQGRFLFEDMPPGSYTVCSQKPGYLYGCYQDERRRSNFTLGAGQKRADVNFQLTREALISGRLVDENGDPITNVRVEPARWSVRARKKSLSSAGVGSGTDAEGNFAIGKLEAGTYYLEVAAQQVFNNDVRSPGRLSYPTTFYPNATDPAKAVEVHVDAGQTVRNVEIHVSMVRGYRIEGKLTAPAADVAPIVNVQLIPALATDPRALAVTMAARDGTFAFDNVLPGVYSLEVKSPAGIGRQAVTVANADIEGLVLQLAPGAVIAGTIVMEGSEPRKLSPEPIVRLVDCCSRDGAQSAIGLFTLRNIFTGTYRVEVDSLPRNAYVKSIHFNEGDVTQDGTNVPLDLSSTHGGSLNIVLSPDAGQAIGTARGADGMPVEYALVTLWKSGTDFVQSTYAREDGQFTLPSLPPGEYRVAAWEEQDTLPATSPELRAAFESKAAAVNVPASGRVRIDPPLFSKKAADAEIGKLP